MAKEKTKRTPLLSRDEIDRLMSDPHLMASTVLELLMTWLLHATPTKPADPAAWEAMGKLDMIRREIQSRAGVDATPLHDPHGRTTFDDDDEG